MRKLIDKIPPPPKPAVTVPLLCALGDAIAILYGYAELQDRAFAINIMDQALLNQGFNPWDIEEGQKLEMFDLAKTGVYAALALVALFHATVYAFFIKGKPFALNYVLTLTVVASPLCLLAGVHFLRSSQPMAALAVTVAAFVYGYLFLSTKRLRTIAGEASPPRDTDRV